MLRGKLKVKDKEFLKSFYDYYKIEESERLKELEYTIFASDVSKELKFFISGERRKDETEKERNLRVMFLDYNEGEDTPKFQFEGSNLAYDPLVYNRRLDSKSSGTYATNLQNLMLAGKISAAVLYVRRYKVPNQQEVKGITHNFNPILEKNIDEHFSEDSYFKGKMVTDIGEIIEFDLENKFISLELENYENSKDKNVYFYKIQKKDNLKNIVSYTPCVNKGYKMTEELLGVPYNGEVVRESVSVGTLFETIEDVIEHHPDKNTDWILNKKYVIVDDDNMEEIIEEFRNHNGYIAMDTETSGLRITFKSREYTHDSDQLVGLVLSKEQGTGYYFPLQHKLFKNLCNGDHYYFMRRYAKEILENKQIVCHNAAFDWKVCYIYGINTNVVADTMVAFGVTKKYENSQYEIGLKSLVKNLFNLDMFDLNDFLTSGTLKDTDVAFWDLSYELVRRYAPADADMTLTLWYYIKDNKLLEKYNAQTVFDMEVAFTKVVSYSEFFGYRVNVKNTDQMETDVISQMKEIEEEMERLAGEPFNPNSPVQLKEIMYDKLGIEKINGSDSTSKNELKALMKMKDKDGNNKYPFVHLLSKYREYSGIYTRFLKKLPEISTQDGFIFPKVSALGATTGRVTVSDPNYQGYDDIVKKNIIPRQGFVMFDSDFSQIEYRVLASLAREKALIEEFEDEDLDYHTYQASRMHKVPYASVTKKLRGESKGINFGLPYGMGDASLGAAVYGTRSDENTKAAAKLRVKFFEGQERILNFFQTVRSKAVEEGYTETHWGRRRYYEKGKVNEASIKRQAGNAIIQGSAADIYKLAVIRLFRAVEANRWLGKVMFNCFVHDEIVMEVSEEINLYYFTKVWQDAFQVQIKDFARLFSGMGFGMSWYDAKSIDFPPAYATQVGEAYKKGMDWAEDGEQFVQDVAEGYKQYKTQRVIDYIEDRDNDGETIKPIIGQLLQAEVINILKDNREYAEELGFKAEEIDLLDGTIDTEKTQLSKEQLISNLANQLVVFSKYHDLRQDYDIISPSSMEISVEEKEEDIDYVEYVNNLQKGKLVKATELQLLADGCAFDEKQQTFYVLDSVWLNSLKTAKEKYVSSGISTLFYIQKRRGPITLSIFADTDGIKAKEPAISVQNCLERLDVDNLISMFVKKRLEMKNLAEKNGLTDVNLIIDEDRKLFIEDTDKLVVK